MFSVVIPYYKKRQYIERCLNSVLNQTFQNFEIILVDDGSEDDILELINEKYTNNVKFVQQTNQGVSEARNTGITNAKTAYIALLDADDCWHPKYLEFVYKVIQENTNIKIIGAHYSRDKNILENQYDSVTYRQIHSYFIDAISNTYFTSSSSVILKDFFNKNRGFNPQLKRGEDLDVWFRVMMSDGNAYYITNTLVYYSDEDISQATALNFDFNLSILSVMASDYIKKEQPIVLQKFAIIFIRKRIYPYFFDSENHNKAKRVLQEIGFGNFFSFLLYHLPRGLGSKFVQGKFIRYYSKYLIK